MKTEKINRKLGADDIVGSNDVDAIDRTINFIAKAKKSKGIALIAESDSPYIVLGKIALRAIEFGSELGKRYMDSNKATVQEYKKTLENIRKKAENPNLTKEEILEYSRQEVEVIKGLCALDKHNLVFTGVAFGAVALAVMGAVGALVYSIAKTKR